MSLSMSRLSLTHSELQKAKRLKAIWVQKKHELGLIQVKAAQQLGIAQPTFNQYLNGNIPLNTDFLLAFAELLDVNPWDIDPEYRNVRSFKKARDSQVISRALPILGSITGKPSINLEALPIVDDLPRDGVYAGIDVDSNDLVSLHIQRGEIIVVVLDQSPLQETRMVMVRRRGSDAFDYCQYIGRTTSTLRFVSPVEEHPFSLRKSAIMQMFLVEKVIGPI